jgi:hypothetical protein
VTIPANLSEALDAFLALPLNHPLRPGQDYLNELLDAEAARVPTWTTTSYDPDDDSALDTGD